MKWVEGAVGNYVTRWAEPHFYDTPLEDVIAALRDGADGLTDPTIDLSADESHGDYYVVAVIRGKR